MTIEDFVRRADELIEKANLLLSLPIPEGRGLLAQVVAPEPGTPVDGGRFAELRVATLSLFSNLFGPDHPYYVEFDSWTNVSHVYHVEKAIGILTAARDELAGGWFHTAKGLVAAEIFTDFLEMADHLLDQDYKDAAAVMIGSVLEEHLRQLAALREVDTTWTDKKGDVLALIHI